MAFANFSSEYNAVRDILSKSSYEGVLKRPMENLQLILDVSGPLFSHNSKLEILRTITFKFKETERILEGAGIATDSTVAPTSDQFKKIAAVKFLRHLHLCGARGSQSVWIHSAPKDYTHFSYDELDGAKATLATIKMKLGKTEEQFSATTKKHFGEATQLGLAWCQKALTVLSTANSNAKSMEKIKRWFAAPDTSGSDLSKTIASLSQGFKKITKTLNDNTFIITDFPADRNDSSKDYTEAYVFTKTEKPKTVYIEKALLSNFDISVLHDMKKNWTRVIVHEVTHIDAKTEDKAYAWAGIKPGVKITAAEAAVNADSWAFFAADCGAALVEGDINRALGGTGGNLNKLLANWN
jgi:hypothetical protein